MNAMNTDDLTKRVAIITGGTRGIGAAISRRFKDAGYAVAAVYHGNMAAAGAFSRDAGIPVYKWDVADFDACQDGVGSVTKDLGGPVDILVNNAGITRDAMLHKMTPAQWGEVIRAMRDHGFGRIVNISSINGQKGQLGHTNYAAAKAGILGFTKALALETASKGITVNAVAPGYIAADMVDAMSEDILAKIEGQIPVGRLGNADEVARIVQFLVSEEAAFITGSTVTANGGQYMA